jgi:hypothetical protein
VEDQENSVESTNGGKYPKSDTSGEFHESGKEGVPVIAFVLL